MTLSYGETLIKYYKDKLNAEIDYDIIKMKFERANKHLLIIKQQKEKFKKQNEFLNLINDKITIGYQNMIEENSLWKTQIKNLQDNLENLNKTMMEDNNSMETEITSIENKILQFNKRVVDRIILQNNKIKLLGNKILELTRNFQDLINGTNSNVEEEKDDGPIDRDGTDDIWQASMEGSLVAVKYWYSMDSASINRKNERYFSTPLHYASDYGHLEIVHFLVSKGVDINAETNTKLTPLMCASRNGHVSVVEALLDDGADINRQDGNEETSLHWAVLGNELSGVKVLIERGADKSIKDKWNSTPLDRARSLIHEYENLSVIEYLASD